MSFPIWNTDDPSDLPVIAVNAAALVRSMEANARHRQPFSNSLLRNWHKAIFVNVSQIPSMNYVGNFRGDTAFEELVMYDVIIGDAAGNELAETAPWFHVDARMNNFEKAMKSVLANADEVLPLPGADTEDDIHGVLQLAAWAHGEFVAIHPFANGNGRVARALANWVLLRYGLEAIVSLVPRPFSELYSECALRSMDPRRDHEPMTNLFVTLYSLF